MAILRDNPYSGSLMCADAEPDMQEALIRAGARVNAVDRDGATALMWAAYKDSAASVQLLIRHGANINVADRSGQTALSYAERYGENGEAAHILKQNGARTGSTWPPREQR